jgi:hypothetical protein
MAAAQLGQIHDIMEQHTLVYGKDRRQSMMLKKNGELDSSLLYRAMKTAYSELDEWTKFVWHNKAPPRVKFFALLLSQERIQSKTLLRKKSCQQHRVQGMSGSRRNDGAHHLWVLLCEEVLGGSWNPDGCGMAHSSAQGYPTSKSHSGKTLHHVFAAELLAHMEDKEQCGF